MEVVTNVWRASPGLTSSASFGRVQFTTDPPPRVRIRCSRISVYVLSPYVASLPSGPVVVSTCGGNASEVLNYRYGLSMPPPLCGSLGAARQPSCSNCRGLALK
jgi:hypothetical protein